MSTERDLRDRTIEILADILETTPAKVRPQDRLREDLGLDSLQSLEMLSMLSEEFRVDLPMEEAMELRTVDDACAFVARACPGVPAARASRE